MALTERSIGALKPGEKLSERLREAPGALLVRMSSAGTREFFYRQQVGGADRTHKLGDHGELSLLEARKKAKALAGAPVALEARGTLGDLLGAYVEHLKAEKKVSAPDVERSLLRAIPETDALRRRRAASITPREITAIVARRVRAGANVDANRLRAHLSAAFFFGMRSDYNPQRAAVDGVRFGLASNPVAPVARVDERPATDENGEAVEPRVLTWQELGAYWRALDAESETIRATLRFVLAIGGQRMQQVLRAEWADVEKRNAEIGLGVIRMLDTKGRGKPRRHAVPIPKLAQEQLDSLAGNERPFPVTHFTLADAISAASKAVCKQLECEPFDARALRRSVETRLGDLGVSRDTRAHLLSHGRTGIQAQRYDFAERLPEKRDALALWERHLRRAIRAASAKRRA
jgi:integrase